MIIEIEYYKNDTKICGGNIDFSELDKCIKQTEKLCDIKEDNFVRILCDLILLKRLKLMNCPTWFMTEILKSFIDHIFD